MAKNVGSIDKIVRIVVALVLAGLIITQTVTGVWAIVLGVVAVVLLGTALMGSCLLYRLFNISTNPK